MLNVVKSYTPLSLKNYYMSFNNWNLMKLIAQFFLLLNFHLNGFCVILKCFTIYLMDVTHSKLGCWIWLKFWTSFNLCYINPFFLKFCAWPYIDDYKSLVVKIIWICVLILLFIIVFFLDLNVFLSLKYHNLKVVFKDKMIIMILK
jgi:hypothetical protein